MCTKQGVRDLVLIDRSQLRDVITNCEAGNLTVLQNFTSVGISNIWIVKIIVPFCIRSDRCYVDVNRIVTGGINP